MLGKIAKTQLGILESCGGFCMNGPTFVAASCAAASAGFYFCLAPAIKGASTSAVHSAAAPITNGKTPIVAAETIIAAQKAAERSMRSTHGVVRPLRHLDPHPRQNASLVPNSSNIYSTYFQGLIVAAGHGARSCRFYSV